MVMAETALTHSRFPVIIDILQHTRANIYDSSEYYKCRMGVRQCPFEFLFCARRSRANTFFASHVHQRPAMPVATRRFVRIKFHGIVVNLSYIFHLTLLKISCFAR